MTVNLASRGFANQFALDAVVTGVADGDFRIAILHEEIFATVDAVLLGAGNVKCQVLERRVLKKGCYCGLCAWGL